MAPPTEAEFLFRFPKTWIASSYLILSSLELGDPNVYAPYIRARLGTAAHFCEVVVLKRGSGPAQVP